MSDPTPTTGATEHGQGVATAEHVGAHEVQPTAFGFLTAPMFIGLAMIVVIAIMIWKKVPGAIARALDSKIALIRDQLAEAETLRKEAEALKAEYEKKAKSADKDRAALIERARHEADEIVAKAKADAEALVERRTRMAEDKIAAEERAAVEQLRASAADAATRAAARLIAERHDAGTDAKLVDQAIKEIAAR
jgi:F-type H+-transporting ATPase subunit b